MAVEYPIKPSEYSPDKYMRLLTGWDWKQTDRRKNIAVLGAGMSGLVCGWLLRKAGHAVTIFEASNVPGGRVKTLRDRFTRGFHAEAGAMRIPSTHLLTKQLVDHQFKLITDLFENSSAHNVIYINDIYRTRGDYKRVPHNFGFELASYEVGTPAKDLFETCIKTFIRRTDDLKDFKYDSKNFPFDIPEHSLSQECRKWRQKFFDVLDLYSLRQFLMEEAFLSDNKEQQLSAGGADLITSLLVYDMHLPSSMAAILGDYGELFSETIELRQIRGGMDLLPAALVRTAETPAGKSADGSLEVRYNCRVIKIKAEEGQLGLTVCYENPIARHAQSNDFDLVVVAVPFSALGHIQMPDLMTPEKRRAVRQLHYDNACKILIEFREMFWDPERITGGSSITDLPVRQIHYPSKPQNENEIGHGVLLASYTWGEDSLRWTSLGIDDRIRFAIRDLERVHRFREDALKKTCTGGMSHSWADDEFTSGAFAMFEPYQSKMFDDIWKPEGRLHYCGEHTSTKHGWIEGAVQSGIRVANEICMRLDKDWNLSAEDVRAPRRR